MPDIATLAISLAVTADGVNVEAYAPRHPFQWSPVVIKRETISLPSATDVALSPPSTARALVVMCEKLPSLRLKGAPGDTGILLTAASGLVGIPAVLPLGASPTPYLRNESPSLYSLVLLWL